MSTPKHLLPRTFRPPVGRKEVWLPNFTLTFLRTPHLPSNMASFIVPLNLNKLDLKDYLWHAYRVPVLSVRSYIVHAPVRQDKPGASVPIPFKWYRPRATKRMIVEIDEGEHGGPFVWPDEIKDFEAWDREAFKAGEDFRENESKTESQRAKKYGTEKRDDAGTVKEQARRLLEGKEAWRPSWREFEKGRERE